MTRFILQSTDPTPPRFPKNRPKTPENAPRWRPESKAMEHLCSHEHASRLASSLFAAHTEAKLRLDWAIGLAANTRCELLEALHPQVAGALARVDGRSLARRRGYAASHRCSLLPHRALWSERALRTDRTLWSLSRHRSRCRRRCRGGCGWLEIWLLLLLMLCAARSDRDFASPTTISLSTHGALLSLQHHISPCLAVFAAATCNAFANNL